VSQGTDQEKYLEKIKKLEDKAEQLKNTNMDLRKQITDFDRVNKGKNFVLIISVFYKKCIKNK
jgi:cell division protein FtsB